MSPPRRKRAVQIFKKSLTEDMLFTRATGLSAADHWAVGIQASDGGWEFWEVTAQSADEKHMAVLGPQGFLAEMIPDHEKHEWMQRFKLAKSLEGRLGTNGDILPRKAVCFDLGRTLLCGLSDRTDREIKSWVTSWVARHPNYRMLSISGGVVDEKEVNCQTFARECVNFLTGFEVPYGDDNEFWRCTVFGTAGISAGVSYVYCRATPGGAKFNASSGPCGSTAAATMTSFVSGAYTRLQIAGVPRLVSIASHADAVQPRHHRLIIRLRNMMRFAR